MNKFEEEILKSKKNSGKPETMEDGYTIGELVSAVMRIDNENEAKAFYDGYVEHLGKLPDLEHEPKRIAQSNIGWCFGEGMAPERIGMWVDVCNATHPVFGTSMPSPQEAEKAGFPGRNFWKGLNLW